ncbi:hypothetical protein L1887_35966 [Cichorium endivia]|nr:hypothetical protein L1887_35966 [Cichorium endivia]
MLSPCSASPLLSPCTATASFPAVRRKMDLKLGYFCDGIDSKYKPFALHLNRRLIHYLRHITVVMILEITLDVYVQITGFEFTKLPKSIIGGAYVLPDDTFWGNPLPLATYFKRKRKNEQGFKHHRRAITNCMLADLCQPQFQESFENPRGQYYGHGDLEIGTQQHNSNSAELGFNDFFKKQSSSFFEEEV